MVSIGKYCGLSSSKPEKMPSSFPGFCSYLRETRINGKKMDKMALYIQKVNVSEILEDNRNLACKSFCRVPLNASDLAFRYVLNDQSLFDQEAQSSFSKIRSFFERPPFENKVKCFKVLTNSLQLSLLDTFRKYLEYFASDQWIDELFSPDFQACVLAPIAEEFQFRYLVQHKLFKEMLIDFFPNHEAFLNSKVWTATRIFMTSSLFGLIHLTNGVESLVGKNKIPFEQASFQAYHAFYGGLTCGILKEASSIWAAIGWHFAHNFIMTYASSSNWDVFFHLQPNSYG